MEAVVAWSYALVPVLVMTAVFIWLDVFKLVTFWETVGLMVLGGLIAAVGPSRIAMGHHWASDVLASYCLGTAFLIGHIGLYRRLKRKT